MTKRKLNPNSLAALKPTQYQPGQSGLAGRKHIDHHKSSPDYWYKYVAGLPAKSPFLKSFVKQCREFFGYTNRWHPTQIELAAHVHWIYTWRDIGKGEFVSLNYITQRIDGAISSVSGKQHPDAVNVNTNNNVIVVLPAKRDITNSTNTTKQIEGKIVDVTNDSNNGGFDDGK